MRVTTSMYYKNLSAQSNRVNTQLFDVNKQIASGHKIQYAYEGTDTFIRTLKLDDEVTTLTQAKESSSSALKFSTQTDTTLNSFTTTLDAFKVKLLEAANSGITSKASMEAIADELMGMRSHLMNLANTSANGQYLFSGTATSTKPIGIDGSYNGNESDMKAFLGSGVQQTYNINGADLFLGDEIGTKRTISTNIPLYNQSLLHPDIMGENINPYNTTATTHLIPSDTIRDMMGDNDDIDDPGVVQHHFYIHGVNHDGTTFKETISMSDEQTVDELLKKIGSAFGNTPTNSIVDVTLNVNGQIEVADKRPGSSKLDFHMVANTDAAGPAANADAILTGGTPVKEFMKSAIEFVGTTGALREPLDIRSYTISQSFVNSFGNNALATTPLSEVVRSDTDHLVINGTDITGAALPVVNFNIAGNTIADLVTQIETSLGLAAGDVKYSSATGQITINDPLPAGVADTTPSLITLGIVSENVNNNPILGLQSSFGHMYDKETFSKSGNVLSGRVSQIVTADNSYADGSSRLGAVAAGITYDSVNDRYLGLDGKVLKLEGLDTNGNSFDLNINLNDAGSTVTGSVGGVPGFTLDIYDAIRPGGTATDAGKVTYQQLMDVVNMALTGALPGIPPALPATDTEYDNAVVTSNLWGRTQLDGNGRLTFEEIDKLVTRASVSLYDVSDTDGDSIRNADDFDSVESSLLQFHTNTALTIHDPKTDFFAMIDEAIAAVREGKHRADGTDGEDPRNGGIQNTIAKIDDLAVHVNKQHAKAGVQSQALQSAIERTDTLMISSMTLRADIIDTDIAEASMRLQQLSLNFQAMLSTVSRVSQLSLVNYLK